MAQWIEHDPSLDVCPDYKSPDFQPIQDLLIEVGHSNKEVIQTLTDMWVTNHTNHKEAWHLQQETDAIQTAE